MLYRRIVISYKSEKTQYQNRFQHFNFLNFNFNNREKYSVQYVCMSITLYPPPPPRETVCKDRPEQEHLGVGISIYTPNIGYWQARLVQKPCKTPQYIPRYMDISNVFRHPCITRTEKMLFCYALAYRVRRQQLCMFR